MDVACKTFQLSSKTQLLQSQSFEKQCNQEPENKGTNHQNPF